MKKIFYLIFSIIVLALTSCTDEGELLVTDRTDCYMSRFQIRGTDNLTILSDVTIGKGIDTTALTVNATVKYGTDLKKLKPNCSLSPESIIEPANGAPAMGTWVDFTKGNYVYTVISGNRKIRKTYTVSVTAQK
jgi:hypothetical protein